MQQRSTFVSVVAWVFIVFSSLGVLLMVMESLVFFLLPFGELAGQGTHAAQPFPFGGFIWIMRGFILFLLAVCIWTLAAAIGLLLRKNWARINFIVIMVIGILFQILGIVWSVLFLFAGFAMPEGSQAGPDMAFMQTFLWVMFFIGLVWNLGFAILYGWITKKLVSPPIRAEFQPVAHAIPESVA